MPFNIPNAADAEDVTQAQPDSRDFNAMIAAAFAGTGIVSGCAVTAQGTPNMTVAVAAGTVAVNGVQASVTGGNVTIAAANATNPRFDLICVDNTGTKSAVAGTAAAAPVFPDPAGKVVLAAVRVPAAASAINSQKIVDKRLNAVLPAPASDATGTYKLFAGTVAPSGYLICDGSAVSRTTYATLFSLVGTSFGAGDGSTTFNLPDLQGRSAVSVAPTGHVDVNAIGKNEGITLANRRPRHNHTNGVTASHNMTLPDHSHGHNFSLPQHAHGVAAQSYFVYVATPDTGYQGYTGMASPGGPHFEGNAGVGTATGGITSTPGISGGVGSVTSQPGIIGGVTIGGLIGPSGTNPIDCQPFLVAGTWIIKT